MAHWRHMRRVSAMAPLLVTLAAFVGCAAAAAPAPVVPPPRGDGHAYTRWLSDLSERQALEVIGSGADEDAAWAARKVAGTAPHEAPTRVKRAVCERMTRTNEPEHLLTLAELAVDMSADYVALRRRVKTGKVTVPNDKRLALITAPPVLLRDFRQMPEAQRVAPRLLEIAGGDEFETACRAAWLLNAFGVPARQAVPAIVRAYALGQRENKHHLGSIGFFYAINGYGTAAAPPLIELLQAGEDEMIRVIAAAFLVLRQPWTGEVAPLSPAVAPALARALREDRSAEVRAAAATALGKIKHPADEAAAEALSRAAANDADARVRKAAQRAVDGS